MPTRFMEYLKYGAGRPPGTMWAMEKSYFEWKYKYPNRTEYAYLRFALQSRYPLNSEIPEIAARCRNLDDAIIEAVRLDFGDFVATLFKPALEALPLCSACGQYRALSTTDTFCYACRNFGDLVPCHRCRLYWKRDAKFCQKCGAPLIEQRKDTEETFEASESIPSPTWLHLPETTPVTGSELEPMSSAAQAEGKFVPRFDFTEGELFQFGITFIVAGRWESYSEKKVADCVMEFVRVLHKMGVKRADLITHVYTPLQLLLMARRHSDFATIQQEPAFSKVGQANLGRLYDAFVIGGEAAFGDERKRLFPSSGGHPEARQEVVTYSGGLGFTKETAVLIKGPDPPMTVAGEYWYLAYTYGRKDVDWRAHTHTLIKRDDSGQMYDLLEIEFADGTRQQFYFDISHLPY